MKVRGITLAAIGPFAACTIAIGAFYLASTKRHDNSALAAPMEEEMESGDKKAVAILLFDGVELLDFAGPAEVFIIANRSRSFRVVTVAETAKPLKTMGGITVTPDYAMDEAPKADILVVPDGNTRAIGKAGREWLKKASGEAEITMSVCYGVFLLADAGLLNGGERGGK